MTSMLLAGSLADLYLKILFLISRRLLVKVQKPLGHIACCASNSIRTEWLCLSFTKSFAAPASFGGTRITPCSSAS